jgi:RimJ/RimL family protein N-acetyltransferase
VAVTERNLTGLAPRLAPRDSLEIGDHASELVVRGGVEPPTFRFSGRTYPQLARIVRVSCAVAGRCCLPLDAAVAVTVAVSYSLASMDGQVTLRPVLEDDLSWLASLRSDPAATGPHGWHGWSDPQRARRRWAESGLLGDNGGTLIVLHGTDRVGTVSWRKVQTGPTASNWAIGIGLAPEFRGRGYGSEAQRLLVRYLFAHTQVNRVEATTEITNVAEQRALEKAGFTREGILRGTTFRQGRWHDQVIYGVLRDEVKLDDSAAEDGMV